MKDESMSFIMSEAVREAYRNGEEDELLNPVVRYDATGKPVGRIKNGDYVIFYDIRGEREVELTESFTELSFDKFKKSEPLIANFSTMILYDQKLKTRVAFPPYGAISNSLSEVISKAGLKQVKLTETEKAIHAGFFLNGKNRDTFPGEERVFVQSSKDVVTFDELPEMSIRELTIEIIKKIHDSSNQFIFVNFPNVDVVGHIENENAILTAVNAVDRHIGLVVEEAILAGVSVVLTADHGTVEKWYYPDGAVDTGHTDSPVPFIIIDPEFPKNCLREAGELQDIAPTVLELLGVEKPPEMTGKTLVNKGNIKSRNRRVMLIIADGWGYNSGDYGNLIKKANTQVFNMLQKEYPSTLLMASGEAVGMPAGTVGNSESGHLHIGSGRRIYSDRVRIDKALEDGSFYKNKAFLWAIEGAKKEYKNLHLLGIVSFYSSHGSINHLFALMEMAKKQKIDNLYIHSLLGRRGERPESGAIYIKKVEEKCRELNIGSVVTVIGRYWALDREENWDRIEKTYNALVNGIGKTVKEE